ncbi:MAG: HEPN domain-containing protein [Clostridia bacterium]|nr:HEPN domain-containing protein [Clostridia bacterium]
MSSEVRKQEAAKWLDKARRDLRVAKMAFNDRDPETDLACYLSQQCAEKSLKALLIQHGIRFAYKHDLAYLVDLLPPNEQQLLAKFDLDWLTDWATEGRYPGDAPPATNEEAKKAIEMAEAIYNTSRRCLLHSE